MKGIDLTAGVTPGSGRISEITRQARQTSRAAIAHSFCCAPTGKNGRGAPDTKDRRHAASHLARSLAAGQ